MSEEQGTEKHWRSGRADFYRAVMETLGLNPKMRVYDLQIQIGTTQPSIVIQMSVYAPDAALEKLGQVLQEHLPEIAEEEKKIRVMVADREEGARL